MIIPNKKFSVDTIWLFIGQFFLVFSSFFLNIIVTNYFGVEKLGIYNQALGIYQIIVVVYSIGINNSIIFHIKKESSFSEQSKVFTSNFVISAVASILLSSITYLITKNFPYLYSSIELARVMLPIIPAIPLFILSKNFMALNTSLRNHKSFALIRSARWVLLIVFTWVFSSLFNDFDLIFIVPFLGEFLILIYCIVINRSKLEFDFRTNEIFSYLKFGISSNASEIFSTLSAKGDLLILGYVLSDLQMGQYSFLIFFAKSLLVFPGILQQNVNPIIKDYFHLNKVHDLISIFKRIKIINFIVLILQIILICIIYPIVIKYIEGYNDTYLLLIFALFSIFPLATISWGGAILVMTGKLKANLVRTLAIVLFSMLSLFFLSIYFSLYGAIFSIFLTSCLSAYLLNSYSSKVLKVQLI